jgi:two-component system, OmpR family, response regulator
VLLVEDDTAVREGVASALVGQGYQVDAVADGTGLAKILETCRPDIAILDVGLKAGPDGFELARQIRATSEIPVVFLTAADRVEDRVRGFDVGCDDYVVKPFSVAELLVRMRALLRRSGRMASSTLQVVDLLIDTSERRAVRNGRPLTLTPTEFDLLATLARTPGQVWSKRELLTEVWGFSDYQPHLVEVHVSALRRKIEAGGSRLIHTERGGGYVLRA